VRRALVATHRWLGIAGGLLFLLWFVSGIAMLWARMPSLDEAERLRLQPKLDLGAARVSPTDAARNLGPATASVRVAMLDGRPVYRFAGPGGWTTIFADDGSVLERLDTDRATRLARALFPEHAATARHDRRLESPDQWTLQSRASLPAHRLRLGDADDTWIYVDEQTGELFLTATRGERRSAYVSAVPHWLYFTPLRKDGSLWSNVVIYASLLGTFLTLTGIYVGLRMYGRGKRKSPFRGAALWHHWTGLIFGLVTLTWVFSGLASMQPWGWLESEGPGEELQALAGRPLEGADAAALVAALAAHPQPGVVSAEAAVQGGRPWAILVRADGSRTRAALPGLAPAPPPEAELAAMAARAKPGAPIVEQRLIHAGDAYYYSHHNSPRHFPAWRVIYGDAENTRLYLDPRTGELTGFVNDGSRGFRWWHLALHRFDVPGLRERPLWDLVTLPLLAGVSLVCLLGVWMGVRRLRRRERARRA